MLAPYPSSGSPKHHPSILSITYTLIARNFDKHIGIGLVVEVGEHQLQRAGNQYAIQGQLETGDGEIRPQALRQTRREVPAATMVGHGKAVFFQAVEVIRAVYIDLGLVQVGAGTADLQVLLLPPFVLA